MLQYLVAKYEFGELNSVSNVPFRSVGKKDPSLQMMSFKNAPQMSRNVVN